jgi:uncharacterized integral membrane protein (TIGR00698 family)
MTFLVWYGNPAVGLLVGASITLIINQPLVAGGTRSGKYLLQTAIVLLGFRLSIGQVLEVSGDTIGVVMIYVLTTLAVGLALARLIGLERVSGILLSSGTAICGGTTIATLAPILNARADQLGIAIAIVFLLNAVALFTFPSVGHWLGLSQTQFGIWTALAIHDTSSVVATAAIYGEEALATATTVKLGRTLWLIPLVVVTSLLMARTSAKVRVPGFILAFLGASVAGSLISLPEVVISSAGTLSKVCLVGALFFVGTEITRGTVAALRGKVVIHALGLWLLAIGATLSAVMWLF